MRRPNLLLVPGWLALLVLATGGASLAQGLGDFEIEARLLDEEISGYASVRARERAALDELQRLNGLLDDSLANPNTAPAELMRLESEIAAARDQACTASQQSAARRTAMYERMRRLAGLARELEGLAAGGGGVGGSWRIEAQAGDLWGLLDLSQQGSLVSGSYRLSNGARGSTRGTFAGARVDLELVDSERGIVASIWGDLDPETGELRGSWQARVLGGGRPSAGHWSAQRVSLEQALTLEP